MTVETIGIESRWGPSDFDMVSKDEPHLVRIVDDGDDPWVRSVILRHYRIYFLDFLEKTGPVASARVDVDLFLAS